MINSPSSDKPIAQQVQDLMTLPQSLCKQRGICCRVATFLGLATPAELEALTHEDSPLGEHAQAFASIFEAYPSHEAVAALAPEFVERVRSKAESQGKQPDDIGFYHCRFVQEDGRCGVHEDRPSGCRGYPVVHEKTLFHPGCGFETAAKVQWQQLDTLLKERFGLSADQIIGGEGA